MDQRNYARVLHDGEGGQAAAHVEFHVQLGRRSAMAASRCRSALENVLRFGGCAPRMLRHSGRRSVKSAFGQSAFGMWRAAASGIPHDAAFASSVPFRLTLTVCFLAEGEEARLRWPWEKRCRAEYRLSPQSKFRLPVSPPLRPARDKGRPVTECPPDPPCASPLTRSSANRTAMRP